MLEISEPQLVAEVLKVVKDQRSFEAVNARINQTRIARDHGRQRKALEGLGRVRMEVDPWVYHYWGQRLGYDCWKDEQFVSEFERDNPEARVECGGTRVQVGWTPGARRYVKRYNETDQRTKNT